MEIEEFRRRIAVYIENDLPELTPEKDRVSEVVATRLWPLVGGWQNQRDLARAGLVEVMSRVREECPEVAAALSTENSGSPTGWP